MEGGQVAAAQAVEHLECWTALDGPHEIDGVPVCLGTTVVLEAGERMPLQSGTWMVATLNKEICHDQN